MMQTFTRPRQAIAAAVLLLAGGGAGAAITHATQPVAVMPAAPPMRIAAVKAATPATFGRDAIVTVRGRVAETFGSRFVIDDGSGRLLVEIGPREAEGLALAQGAMVTVQGRQDDGVLRAMFLTDAQGIAHAFGPGRGPGGHPGPRHGGGPDRAGRPGDGPAAPPPPPPPAPDAAPPAA